MNYPNIVTNELDAVSQDFLNSQEAQNLVHELAAAIVTEPNPDSDGEESTDEPAQDE